MNRELRLPFPIAYITRDIERALGIPPTPGFFIMTNETPFGKSIQKTRSDIILCSNNHILDTHDLIAHEEVLRALREHAITHIMVFKPTKAIERLADMHGLTLLNPQASLASSVEEKITQLSFLPELKEVFVPFQVMTLKEVGFTGTPMVLQFNHSHTGSGTHYIDSAETLATLCAQFPERPVRTAPFIHGPIYTNNNVVTSRGVLVGNINYQITGLAPFTTHAFATIGNDWALPRHTLTEKENGAYHAIAQRVGKALQSRGWKGLFGIDVIHNTKTGQLHLLEINARQSASATFESFLQAQAGNGRTSMEAHLLALVDEPVTDDLQPISEGAQVTQKNILPRMPTEAQHTLTQTFEQEGYMVTPYQNTEREQDWLRIQTTHGGFVAAHGIVNTRGAHIAEIIQHTL